MVYECSPDTRTMQEQNGHPQRVSSRELFFAFTRITLASFGGALFWSRRAIVERHRWLSEHEFVEILALAQLLPGANGVNLAASTGCAALFPRSRDFSPRLSR
jgi:chromate transport protein ChrA